MSDVKFTLPTENDDSTAGSGSEDGTTEIPDAAKGRRLSVKVSCSL